MGLYLLAHAIPRISHGEFYLITYDLVNKVIQPSLVYLSRIVKEIGNYSKSAAYDRYRFGIPVNLWERSELRYRAS